MISQIFSKNVVNEIESEIEAQAIEGELKGIKVKINHNGNWNINLEVNPNIHEDVNGNNVSTSKVNITAHLRKGANSFLFIGLLAILAIGIIAAPEDEPLEVLMKQIGKRF